MTNAGLVVEFEKLDELIRAIEWARASGYRQLEAFTPFPSEELADALELREPWLAALVFLGGVTGGAGAFLVQWYAMAFDYPLDVGGRPLFSWPAFVPISFEMTVLGAALTGLVAMLALNRLPRLHHPVFAVPGFERASSDRFFLWIVDVKRASDARAVSDELAHRGAVAITPLDSMREEEQ